MRLSFFSSIFHPCSFGKSLSLLNNARRMYTMHGARCTCTYAWPSHGRTHSLLVSSNITMCWWIQNTILNRSTWPLEEWYQTKTKLYQKSIQGPTYIDPKLHNQLHAWLAHSYCHYCHTGAAAEMVGVCGTGGSELWLIHFSIIIVRVNPLAHNCCCLKNTTL